MRWCAPTLWQSRRDCRRSLAASQQGNQHLFLAHHQRGGVVARRLEAMSMRNCIRRTSLHAIAAKDAAVVIDVIDFRVPLRAAVPFFGRILCCFDINAVGRACRRAKKTSDTLLQSVFISLQNVRSAIAFLQHRRPVRISFRDRRLKKFFQRDAHPFGYGCRRTDYFTNLCHSSSGYRSASRSSAMAPITFSFFRLWSFR